VHGRVFDPPAVRSRVGVDGINHVSPGIDVLLIARNPQRVVEANEGAWNAMSIFPSAIDRVDWTKAPAVGVAPPFALGTAYLSIQVNVARNDPMVLLHAVHPSIHVFENPFLVLVLVREH